VGMSVKEVKRRIGFFRSMLKSAVKSGGSFYGRPGTLMADLLKLNPLRAFRKVKTRTLILAGQADVTAREDDVNALRAGMPKNKKITIARPNNVGHLLQHSPRYLEVTEMWKIPSGISKAARKILRDWIKKALK
jgi:pimeloyl-ACP methyl ester carboxylesterase